jgi:cation:H+ antiporter
MFADAPLVANVGVFVACAAAVWFAGTRVARYADAIQERTGAGEALVGMLLLGFITALPEVAVTVTASYSGNAQLAVNNLLGGMALNVAILAAADAAVRHEALTAAVASPTPLLQGALLIVLLAIVAAATVVSAGAWLGIGLWSWAILAAYLLCLLMMRNAREAWVVREGSGERAGTPHEAARSAGKGTAPMPALIGRTLLGAAAILLAGYLLAKSGDALAEQTGLGDSFFGAVFLALSTSLPEITIVFSSVRIGRYAMAVANIFGANLLGLALLFVVDAAYRGGPVLAEAGRFATFAAVLGIAVTALFLAGLVERSRRRILRMGLDSLAVLGTYAVGIVLLYGLRT